MEIVDDCASNIAKMSSVTMRNVWLCLVLLRLAWTCLPQTGYIHPDEFFQSIEVASGLHLAVLFSVFILIPEFLLVGQHL